MSEPVAQISFGPEQCPLCGQPNDCQLCTVAAYKGPCWCAKVEIPDALLAQVPPDLRNKNCICRSCVLVFHRQQRGIDSAQAPDDFYFEDGLMVFTAGCHRRRGYCCENNCRHCPYPTKEKSFTLL